MASCTHSAMKNYIGATDLYCYRGETPMMVLDTVTQNLCYRRVEKVFAGRHMVYSVSKQDFIPLAHNAVVSPIDHYLLVGGSNQTMNPHPIKNYLLVTYEDDTIVIESRQCRAVGLTGFERISDRIALTWIENEPMNIINCLDL